MPFQRGKNHPDPEVDTLGFLRMPSRTIVNVHMHDDDPEVVMLGDAGKDNGVIGVITLGDTSIFFEDRSDVRRMREALDELYRLLPDDTLTGDDVPF